MSLAKRLVRKSLSVAEKGWLAGIIDGEGHLSIVVNPRENPRYGDRLRVLFSITNTDRAIIRRARNLLGVGSISKRKYANRKKRWDIIVRGNETIANTLRPLMPYLVGKHEEAQIILNFVALRKRRGLKTHYGEEEKYLFDSMLKFRTVRAKPYIPMSDGRPIGSGTRKLNASQVREMRDKYGTGQFTQAQLGRRYGVDVASVYHIVKGDSWSTETPLSVARPLYLIVKKKWFEQICRGTKTVEYRRKKAYWTKRLFNSDGSQKSFLWIEFRNGYSNDEKHKARFEFGGVHEGSNCYAISIGKPIP